MFIKPSLILAACSGNRRKEQKWAKKILFAISERGGDISGISCRVLEALMVAQGYRCAFTQEEFILPESSSNTNRGYREQLDRQDAWTRYRSPVLVRFDRHKPYELGNMFFLCEPFAVIYEGAGTEEREDKVPGINQTVPILPYQVYKRLYGEDE